MRTLRSRTRSAAHAPLFGARSARSPRAGGGLGDLAAHLAPACIALACACAAAACGGAQGAQGGPSTPGSAGATEGADSGAPAASEADGSAVTTPGPATTTAALGDAGAAGTKLAEVHSPAPTDGGGASASSGAGPRAHDHDPGRGPADIRALIAARRDDTYACYERARGDHPDIEGDLVITFTIDPKGAVTQTGFDAARSQITEPAVIDCLTAIIKKIQFAPSPGGFETRASYPFKFRPRHGRSPGSP